MHIVSRCVIDEDQRMGMLIDSPEDLYWIKQWTVTASSPSHYLKEGGMWRSGL